MKLCYTLLLCFIALMARAQAQDAKQAPDPKYTLSPALDVRPDGCYKVLCMKNGNTMLFHFELGKKIVVTVFDSLHKQIGSSQQPTHVLDLYQLELVNFRGLYEINGEAVLFLDQDINGKPSLVMLRYSATTGQMEEERLVGESKSQNRRIRFYVMKNKDDDNYEILFCMDKQHPKESDIYMVYFDNHHKTIREVQLEVERKKYDFLEVIGAESQPSGVFITLGLDKSSVYGGPADLNRTDFATPDHDSALTAGASVFHHYLACYFIPKDSPVVRKGLVDLSEDIYPHYTLYTYNPFAASLNVLLYSYKPTYYRFGLNEYRGTISSDIFFKIDKDDMAVDYEVIKNAKANEHARSEGCRQTFFGMPVKLFTNRNGLSTIVSQSFLRDGQPETSARFDYEDYFGNIAITQFDDFGKELWGVVLPFAQYYKSNRHFLDERQLSRRWQDQELFGDLPGAVHDRQFLSFNTYTWHNNYYVIYNDYNKNFNSNLRRGSDTVYTFDNTNTCYYSVDKQKQVTKHYMFADAGKGEFFTSFVEGADFDEQRGEYATLVQYKKYGKTSLRMAWRKLD